MLRSALTPLLFGLVLGMPASAQGRPVTILDAGFYWKHQSIPSTQGEWLALVVKDKAELVPTRIHSTRDRDFPDAFTLSSREHPDALVFLKGLPARKYPLAIPMATREEPKRQEGASRIRTIFPYQSEAWGPFRIVLSVDMEKPGPESGSFLATLTLTLKDRKQALIVIPLRTESESLEPHWVGDLDGDGRPDVLLREEVQGGFQRLRLYLSSAAKEDELVRQVVHLTHGGE